MKKLPFIPAKFLILLTYLPFLVISQSTSSPSEEKILLKIKEQWGNQPEMESWKSTTPHCQWHGINCFGGESVTGISLHSEDIKGEIPLSICDLKNLTSLDLGDNFISGNFPTILYNCTKLQTLVLYSNLLYSAGIDHNRKNLHLSTKYLALIIILAFVAFLVISYFILFIITEIRHRKNNKDESTWNLTPFHKLDFTEEHILGNLSENNVIGSGVFGKVYKININQAGDVVAVKKILDKKKLSISSEKQFIAEFQILGTIRHLNIVKLLCCLSCEDSKLLVYEYMENQSLDKWIHEDKTPPLSSNSGSVQNRVLDWPTRLKIAMGSAQGLCYMHHGCSPPIIHRDVKSFAGF